MKRILLLGLVLIILLSSCKPNITRGPRGLILFEDMNEEFVRCITPWELQENYEGEFVIDSQEEYEALLEHKSISPRCGDFELPPIGFSKKMLLGKFTKGGGCEIDFNRIIYHDIDEKKIYYSIEVVEEGNCDMLGVSMNWALIPKPKTPDYYEIVFEVKVGSEPVEDEFCGSSKYTSCKSDSDCVAAGCSGQVCAGKDEQIITDCMARPCYNAEQYNLECSCLDGKCQWTKAYDLPKPEPSSLHYCEKDEDCKLFWGPDHCGCGNKDYEFPDDPEFARPSLVCEGDPEYVCTCVENRCQ